MSLREKSAWITVILVLVCFGMYFGVVATGSVHRGPETFRFLILCAGVFVALQIGLNAAAALTTPKDGRTLKDEREELIQARSQSLGYYVLAALVVGLGVPFHLGHPAPDLLNFALLDVVVAGLVVAVAQIVMYRRGF
jgi:Trk-type K+ transport system membrane component